MRELLDEKRSNTVNSSVREMGEIFDVLPALRIKPVGFRFDPSRQVVQELLAKLEHRRLLRAASLTANDRVPEFLLQPFRLVLASRAERFLIPLAF